MCVRPARLNQQKVVGLTVPCGQCVECRLKRSRDWAIRCYHELQMHEGVGSFATLTVADDFLFRRYQKWHEGHLIWTGSLDRRVFPLFMKRLRKEMGPTRYFHAGEYGEENGRPHYHALLFGLRFADARPDGESRSGYPAFVSDALSWLWPYGTSQIGEITFESAQYVARYCLKKITGAGAEAHYKRVDAAGVLHQLEPEYATMSRRPGIGASWIAKYGDQVFRDDSVVRDGHEMAPPRYYDKQLSDARMEVMRLRRLRKRGERVRMNPLRWQENACREVIAVARLRQLEEARR